MLKETCKKAWAFLFLLLFLTTAAKAQVISLSNEPGQFISDLEDVFKKGKNEIAIAEFNSFKPHFENGFNDEARKDFIQLSQAMVKRGHKMPEFYELLLLMNVAMNKEAVPEAQRNRLISYLRLLAASQPLRETISTYRTLHQFLTQNLLYTSKFNKLYVFNGAFDFAYFDKPKDYFDNKESAENPEKIQEPEEDYGLFDDWNKPEAEYDPWDDPNLEVKAGDYRLIPIPKISNLIIVLKEADLVFVTPSDSLFLKNTSGAVDLLAETFVGEGGSVTWENVFLPEVKADLSEYTFKIHKPYVQAEKVTFTYEDRLEEPIEGVFELKATSRNKNEPAQFPRFKSYENKARFKNLQDGLTYTGGFSLIGNRVFSTSLYHNISTLWVNKGETNSFRVDGKKIEFTDSLITSNQVIFMSPIGEDSIFHQAVQFRYEIPNKQLTLTKVPKGGFRNSMYSDTFHEMDIKCDAMKWNLNTGKMDFLIIAGKSEVPAIFESFNYYNQGLLRELSNIAGFNPLIFLGNYLFKKGVNRFDLFEIQDKIPKTPSQIKNGVLLALQMGFLVYDPYTDTYSLSRKGIHYFKSAIGRGDYDDLMFASVAGNGAGNASIDRNSNALDISGTKEFKLSDSLGIRFLPKDQSLKMEGSKSFKFNGEIVVKNYRIYGDFEVDYEQFLVNLNQIDSIIFTPATIYQKGGRVIIGQNITYGKTGTLYLNAPDNKSGRKRIPQYPRLVVPDGAVVHFNENFRKQPYGDEVFFKIDHIDHDSLNTEDLAYSGMFNSGGIFAPFRETLTVMPDTSVGFIHKPRSAYKLYGAASEFKFDEPLRMTREGLVSKGTLSHLAANLPLEKARFGTEVMEMAGESGSIKETYLNNQTYFPDVKINNYTATWKPAQDSLVLASTETFSFYNASTRLTGGLVIRNSGLYGQGKLERNDSETESDAIKFNKSGFHGGESSFLVKSGEENGKSVLEGQRVDVDFNLENQLVDISPVSGSIDDTLLSSISFPYAAYKTSIDNAIWDIKKKTISMKGDVQKSHFTATAPNQFGLTFSGSEALYDIDKNTLNVSGVPGINTVDAIIVPADGKVAVLAEGKLEPFTNATVIADTLNKYHTLTEANITINSKLSYSGNASYRFENVSGEVFNIKMGSFEFAEITPEGEILKSKKSEKLSTIARASLTEKDSVYLSPKILYIGDMTMLAPFKNLNLRGQVTPVLTNYPVLGNNWINYSGNKSEEILINVDEILKDGGKPLYAGIHLNPTSSSEALYPTFLSAKRSEDDYDVFLARGIFMRDEANKRFVIESGSKNDRVANSNTYELYDEEGLIKLSGRYNLLTPDLSQFVETVGLAEITLDSLSFDFNTLMKFNFPIPIPMVAKMGDNIVKTNLDAGNSDPGFIFDSPEFSAKLSAFLSPKETNDYQEQYLKGHVPLFKLSPKFFGSIVFSDLKLKWNPVFNSYRSVGPLGISNIGETDINASVPGYFEIIKNPRLGDEIYIFLELSPDTWYYLGYKGGQLGIISSDFEFNKMLNSDDKAKSTKGMEIMNADMAEAMAFRKRFLMSYLGVSEEAFKKPARTPVAAPGAITPVQVPASATEDGTSTQPAKKPAVEQQDGF